MVANLVLRSSAKAAISDHVVKLFHIKSTVFRFIGDVHD